MGSRETWMAVLESYRQDIRSGVLEQKWCMTDLSWATLSNPVLKDKVLTRLRSAAQPKNKTLTQTELAQLTLNAELRRYKGLIHADKIESAVQNAQLIIDGTRMVMPLRINTAQLESILDGLDSGNAMTVIDAVQIIAELKDAEKIKNDRQGTAQAGLGASFASHTALYHRLTKYESRAKAVLTEHKKICKDFSFVRWINATHPDLLENYRHTPEYLLISEEKIRESEESAN